MLTGWNHDITAHVSISRLFDDRIESSVSLHGSLDFTNPRPRLQALFDAPAIDSIFLSILRHSKKHRLDRSMSIPTAVLGQGADSLFVGFVPFRSVLLSSTRPDFEEMISRSEHNRSTAEAVPSAADEYSIRVDDSKQKTIPNDTRLIRSVAIDAAWLYVQNVKKLVHAVPQLMNFPARVSRITDTVMAISLGVSRAPDAAVIRVYIQPSNGIDADDLKDVLEGILAAPGFMVTPESLPLQVEKPDIDVIDDLVRVRVRMREDDFFKLVQAIYSESRKSALKD